MWNCAPACTTEPPARAPSTVTAMMTPPAPAGRATIYPRGKALGAMGSRAHRRVHLLQASFARRRGVQWQERTVSASEQL